MEIKCRHLLAAAIAAVMAGGCSSRTADAPEAMTQHLRFPVVLTRADADANQLQFEERVIERVAMQSAYPRCEKGGYPCVSIVPERSKKLYGVDALRVTYFSAPEREGALARLNVKKEASQNGRGYFVSVTKAEEPSGSDDSMIEDAAHLDAPRSARFCK